MKIKIASITSGVVLIIIALFTVFDNSIIGYYGYFRTDFLGNLIHFLSGVALIVVPLRYVDKTSKTLRGMGGFYLALAGLGAIITGYSDYGSIFGMASSGPDHVLHLLIGLVLLILGTRTMRETSVDALL